MKAHFVGIVHNDPRAEERAVESLRSIQPDVIGMEWPGEKYERFQLSPDIVRMRHEIDSAIRSVFVEFDLDPDLYAEESKRRIWDTHHSAVREYARQNGVPLIAMESSDDRIAQDLGYLRDIESARAFYRDWLSSLRANGQSYPPDRDFVFDDNEAYLDFEDHVDHSLSLDDLVDRNHRNGIYRPERVAYQVAGVQGAIDRVGASGTFLHFGGYAHLIERSVAHESHINLWENLRKSCPVQLQRHSLRQFSI